MTEAIITFNLAQGWTAYVSYKVVKNRFEEIVEIEVRRLEMAVNQRVVFSPQLLVLETGQRITQKVMAEFYTKATEARSLAQQHL